MSPKRPPFLRLVAMTAPGSSHRLSFMAADEGAARREASHWYVRLREEEDDEAVKAEFVRWLHVDPAHAEAWRSMCETMETVGRAPPEWRAYAMPGPPRPGKGVRPVRRGAQPRKRRVQVAVGALAAACAFALALPTISLRLQADHITSAGQIEQVRLADGSTVQIGPDSAIAVAYSDSGRTVRLLSGQALFDVTHDPARPFRVEAGKVTTTVLGTSFDVGMLGNATSVAVARGHVRVEDAGATPAMKRDLLAGDMIRIDTGHAVEMGKVTPQLVGGWQRGEALAENRTIASVVDEIRPWFTGRIYVTDAKLAGRRVTGIYNIKNPEQALAMIVQPYGGRITHITPWIIVISGT
jgi:transmembrane sensor